MGGIYSEYPNKIFPGEYGYKFPKDICNSGWWNEKNLKFDSSWDWLMPTWFKFRDLTFKDRKNEIPHSHHCQSISRAICYEDIGSAYSRLSTAIEWHLATTHTNQP